MKKIALLAIAVAAIYFGYWKDKAFKSDFVFGGEIYNHASTKSGGEITNYFYTPKGTDINTAKKFVQVIRFSDNITKDTWTTTLSPILSQYNLKPVRKKEFKLAGHATQQGLHFNSYGTSIIIDGKEHMAFYVMNVDEAKDNQSSSNKMKVINELRDIQLD